MLFQSKPNLAENSMSILFRQDVSSSRMVFKGLLGTATSCNIVEISAKKGLL